MTTEEGIIKWRDALLFTDFPVNSNCLYNAEKLCYNPHERLKMCILQSIRRVIDKGMNSKRKVTVLNDRRDENTYETKVQLV